MPDRWEILVLDGMSTDKTREIVSRLSQRHPEVVLVDNHERTKPKALNLGIERARGQIVMRIDAHAEYESDYIRRCLDCIQETDADNVGGVRKTHVRQGDGALAMAAALAVSDPVAVGDAHYRSSNQQQRKYVDTVFCGCYRREVFRSHRAVQ